MNRTEELLAEELEKLKDGGNLRSLPQSLHEGRHILSHGRKMLNLSSNDYLGIAAEGRLWKEFLKEGYHENGLPTSSSSRLLTGNFPEYNELEQKLARLCGKQSALVLSSGYHANTGILPALCTHKSLILADKLVHASIIDGIRLSGAQYIRYRHNDYGQLECLLEDSHDRHDRIFIATESIFSMDGDEADLERLVSLKRRYPNVMLYVDEAHAFGVRGMNGAGCSEERGISGDIDILVGTFGKATASAGAYVACSSIIREYLINRMRTLIFTTALPPLIIKWTSFIIDRLPSMKTEREQLAAISGAANRLLENKGFHTPSTSHIIPVITGDSASAILKAQKLQEAGFYVLPVRPPTVPAGSSRIRLSLCAGTPWEDIERLIKSI